MTKEHLEIELKLAINAKGHQTLLKHLHQEGPTLQQTNHFFDSIDQTLRSNQWALRCRHENGSLQLTCKGPSDRRQDGISSRVEIEAPTTSDILTKLQEGTSLHEIDHPSAHHLLNMFGRLELVPGLSFQNERRRLPWEGALIELDHSICCLQHRYEIEVEGSEEELAVWSPELQKKLQLWGISHSKATESKLSWATHLFEDSP